MNDFEKIEDLLNDIGIKYTMKLCDDRGIEITIDEDPNFLDGIIDLEIDEFARLVIDFYDGNYNGFTLKVCHKSK